ncbi:hypothetical protein GCM10011502_27120 [Oceanisphaera marina]|uniref:AraC-type arabinose-binding/dimerisation domain-containing protein n=1 Tax=Oceanisphaera marina TaxID=2017550 RepID=A0ABQ1IW81_9GAMM|nr:hypothetical protein [Oceanisphaera marina]GGB52548.1 hypothetical protein GCM10011502_27120 [Oceanisphaera marina]
MTTSAHYPIDHQLLELPHLSPGKRQRQLKGILLIVHQGGGLLQLGRHYYPLVTKDAVFLPADTLFAWHSFAHSRVSRLAFSPRLPQPTKAGRLVSAPLLLAGAERLADGQVPPDWQGAHGRLCRVLHDELLRHQPQHMSNPSPLLQKVSDNIAGFTLSSMEEAEFKLAFNADSHSVKQQCALLLILRDLAKSPQIEQLVQRHGFASLAQFEQAYNDWLGTSNDTGAKNG